MATTEVRQARRSPLSRTHRVPDDPRYVAELRRTYVAWTSGIDALVGVWLVIAPWVLGYSDVPSALWTSVSAGTTVLLVALLRIANPDQTAPLGWANVVLGAWLVAAPAVIPYGPGVHTAPIYWNDILSGVGIMWFAIWSMAAAP